MNTTKFLTLLFGVLLVLSAIAAVWRPDRALHGKVPLVWVSDNNPARTLQIAAFNEENPGLSLRLDYGNNGPQKIILQSSSGVGPDIFDYQDDDIGTFVEAGVLWDVTEPAARMGFSARNDGWKSGVNTLIYKDRQYGFPCNIGCGILIYNKNVFDYFGAPYPKALMTWEEFIALAKQVNSATNPTGDPKRPIYAVSGVDWRVFFTTQRGEYFREDGQLNISDSPELRQAFAIHREFLFTYRFTPTSVEAKAMSGQGGWGSGNLNQFAAGRFAMTSTGHWSLIAFGRAYQQQIEFLKSRGLKEEDIKNPLDRPLRLGAVLIPHFAGRPPSYRVHRRVAGINAKSPRREEALQFLQYLAGPTYSGLLNEGTDWLPGNPQYAQLGVDPGPSALARPELQKATEDAMAYGYVPRRSPFLLSGDVNRVLGEQISRMESNPSISVEALLQAAEADLKTLMRRNLERNPTLKKLYLERFGEASFKTL